MPCNVIILSQILSGVVLRWWNWKKKSAWRCSAMLSSFLKYCQVWFSGVGTGKKKSAWRCSAMSSSFLKYCQVWFSGDGTGKKNLPKDAVQCHHPFSNTVWCGSQVMELKKKSAWRCSAMSSSFLKYCQVWFSGVGTGKKICLKMQCNVIILSQVQSDAVLRWWNRKKKCKPIILKTQFTVTVQQQARTLRRCLGDSTKKQKQKIISIKMLCNVNVHQPAETHWCNAQVTELKNKTKH